MVNAQSLHLARKLSARNCAQFIQDNPAGWLASDTQLKAPLPYSHSYLFLCPHRMGQPASLFLVSGGLYDCWEYVWPWSGLAGIGRSLDYTPLSPGSICVEFTCKDIPTKSGNFFL